MKPKYEVYYGGLGSGKSKYALDQLPPERVFKLGAGNKFLDWIYLRPGAVKKHELDNIRRGIEFKGTTPDQIVADIEEIKKPILAIDDWTTFYKYSTLWSPERISQKCREVFDSINNNKNLEMVVFVVWDAQTWLPFGLYKKRAVWNKELFKVADEITKIEYGIPLRIK